MDLVFDISQDEMPIFLAETEDHIQALDEGLVRLEREESDPELIQVLFRAAHTLKGSAGMIGHKRLVELTHALETAFDGVRKGTLPISTPLVDLCLDAVDGLRLLRDEVVDGKASPVDVPSLVARFNTFIQTVQSGQAPANPPAQAPSVIPSAAAPGQSQPAGSGALVVQAQIAPNSVASSARAFQLMLALQDLGQILSMEPSQAQIETCAPVAQFTARVATSKSPAEVRKALDSISEINSLLVQSENGAGQPASEPPAASPEQSLPEEDLPRLGDYLVEKGCINAAQLEEALRLQKKPENEGLLLGQVLVKANMASQEALDRHVANFMGQQRAAIQALQGSAERNKDKINEKTVRTSVERLDNLMNLVGELITDRNRLNKVRSDLELKLHGNEEVGSLAETIAHVSRITDQLQEEVMLIRMVPIANVFNKFPRMVRDLAQKAGKQINLEIQGQDTELDRSVIEEINDPLIHLLRNSVDHGIEPSQERSAAGKNPTGTVRLTARHEQGRIILTVEDDGRGIDVEKLKSTAIQKGLISEAEASVLSEEKAIDLIFISGLSTAKKITDISGRGVGMDIVRNNIERINGSILVDTTVGKGTQFQIILPLTLAIVPTLLVRVNTIPFAIPLVVVTETLRMSKDEIKTVHGHPVIVLRGQVLPLMRLSDVFDLEGKKNDQQDYSYVVVVNSSKKQIGLMVDALIGEEEVVVKSLGSILGDVTGISSAAILGDGQVALIIDIQGLFKLASIH